MTYKSKKTVHKSAFGEGLLTSEMIKRQLLIDIMKDFRLQDLTKITKAQFVGSSTTSFYNVLKGSPCGPSIEQSDLFDYELIIEVDN